ncbi:MAG TPA: suppressor of fused domain protein [Phycisphaerales bacterium]|nr:suppressor of fused domain protein [Phycisphaerales bacterium]
MTLNPGKPANRDEDNDDDLPREVTPGGSEVIRHEANFAEDPGCAYLDEAEMVAIQDHVREHIGDVVDVMHEIASEGVHLDIVPVHVDDEDGDFTFAVTMGMSAAPMNMPPMQLEPGEEDDFALPSPYAELFIVLPGHWPVTQEALENPENWWPFFLLKECGRLPVLFDTFLGPGHTVPNGDPPEPLAPGCPFVGAVVVQGEIISEEFSRLETEGKTIDFLFLAPLHADEMRYKLEHGYNALLDLFEQKEMDPFELANPERPSVCS